MMLINYSIQNNFAKMSTRLPALILVAFVVYCSKDVINGASIGKRIFGLAVRNSRNSTETPSVPKLFLRNTLTFIWPIEFLILVFSEEKTKIGDRIAVTDVYRLTKKSKKFVSIITAILIFTLFVTSILFGVTSIIKNDSSYKTAVNYIESDQDIIDYVGEIQGFGFFLSGGLNSYSENGNRYGAAYYRIKVIGTKKIIHIYIGMSKEPDKDWEITSINY